MKNGQKIVCCKPQGRHDIKRGIIYTIKQVMENGRMIELVEFPNEEFGAWRFRSLIKDEDLPPLPPDKCQHVWKGVLGIYKTYYNCVKCDMKKEDYEKQQTKIVDDVNVNDPPWADTEDDDSLWAF